MKKEIFILNNGFRITYCKTKAGFSVKPLKKVKLDLTKIKKKFKIMMDTPILLVIDKKDPLVKEEAIIHGYGEIVFKKLADVDKIKKIAEKIYKIGLISN